MFAATSDYTMETIRLSDEYPCNDSVLNDFHKIVENVKIKLNFTYYKRIFKLIKLHNVPKS